MDRDDVRAAAAALTGRIVRTPLLGAPVLGEDLWVKAELFQRGGSFKVRGATHKLDTVAAGPVTTVSAGNHARGLALACRDAGVDCTVFMWQGADAYKVAATRALGATVDLSPADATEAFEAMAAFAERTGAAVVHPFDDPATIAGQGTVGLEISEDLPDAGTVVVPVGGGGLLAGIALALDESVRLVAVEPEASPSLSAALEAGGPVAVPTGGTAAQALAAPSFGQLNFEICRERVDEVLTLSEEQLTAGLRTAYADLKLACEVGGAAAVAAHVAGALDVSGPTVLVLSGGNIAPGALREHL